MQCGASSSSTGRADVNGRSSYGTYDSYGQQVGQQYYVAALPIAGDMYGDASKFGVSRTFSSNNISARALEDLKLLAYLVTVSLFCLFAGPTVLSWQIGRDPDGAFWLGRFGLYAGLVPIFNLIMHCVHLLYLERGGRRRLVVLIAGLCPAVLLCGIGVLIAWRTRPYTIKVLSEECDHASLPKRAIALQEAYDEAHGVYDVCVHRISKQYGGYHRRPLLQNCEEWIRGDNASTLPWQSHKIRRPQNSSKGVLRRYKHADEWWYLAAMEANHDCSGFCAAGPPLWTPQIPEVAGKQRCAPVVAMHLQHMRKQGEAIFGSSLVGLALFLAMYFGAAPIFKRAGYED